MQINNLNKIVQILTKFDILLKEKTARSFEILNPDYAILSIKQLTKVIYFYFLKNKNGFVRLIVQTEMQKVFLDKCILKLNLFTKVKVFCGIEELKQKKKNSLVIFLGNRQDFSKSIKQLFLMKNFIIYHIDDENLNNCFGTYFCSSRIKDLKSLSFIITLIATTIQNLE